MVTRTPPSAEQAARTRVACLRGIQKAFGPVAAVDGVTIELYAGEIHALLGENGAGKTTAMKMLAGILQPDAGEIELQGETVTLRDRRDGARRGVGMVQQHFGLVEELTGVENLMLSDPFAGRITNERRAAEKLRAVGEELGFSIEPHRRVADLTVGERQRLEILIALTTDPAVLIMDEPTAALGGGEVGALGTVLRRLAADGKAIVYITHKLREVMELSDRVTVMRRGRVVETHATSTTSVDQLAEALIGERPPSMGRRPGQGAGDVVAALRGVTVEDEGHGGLAGVDLEVRKGEIVGVAGVTGNGQEALAGVLTGALAPDAGTVERPGTVGYVPEDRAREGLAASLPVSDNAIVHRHHDPALSRAGRLRPSAVKAFAERLVERAGVRLPGVDRTAATLSGGNQQRLVLARELEREPELIVAHNPYRGLDIGAIADVQRQLLDARDAGTAVVVISPDLDDLFSLADRLIVLFEGRIVGVLETETATVQEMGRLMAGVA
jgi:ABC-type uncharacterized transport system ATPase subunit